VRELAPQVLAVLVRRGSDFAVAEDAVQDALLEAYVHWADAVPDDAKGWLIRVAGRKLIDTHRSEAARRRREELDALEPPAGPAAELDDTLLLLFLCCHPGLSPASAIALTLRAVGGLTTREIADAFLVPEATMAQRISRAKRTVAAGGFGRPGDLAVVLRVLYLIFTEGVDGRTALADEAIRMTRVLRRESDEPEVAGLLALMLLTHARSAARTDAAGALVSLDEQDRSRWDRAMIAEGVRVLQGALALERRGEYQLQAAIAALHDDAATVAETDWPQIVEWYDELVALTGNPLARLSRAVAVGEVDGPLAGMRETLGLDADLPGHHRLAAVRAYLHERAGQHSTAAQLYRDAAAGTRSTLERDHLTRCAARAHAAAR
jgi:RNA polymerase sigma factor (sigma-70 family)